MMVSLEACVTNDDSLDAGVAVKLQGLGGEEPLAALIVRGRRFEDPRHGRPWLIVRAFVRAVGPGSRSGRRNARLDGARCPRQSAPVSPPPRITTCRSVASIEVGARVAHREIRPLRDRSSRDTRRRGSAPGTGMQPRSRRTQGQDHGVELGLQLCERRRLAHRDAGVEGDAGGLHDREASIEDGLLQLELGNAVAQ